MRSARARAGRRLRRGPHTRPRPALTELAELAIVCESGFVLTLDEAHLASRREALHARCAPAGGHRRALAWWSWRSRACRRCGPPSIPSTSKRGAWHELGLLSGEDTVRALRLPAEEAGRPMVQDAAILLAEASGGYPYAIQLYGHHAWRAANGHDRIDLAAAQAALPRAQRELESGLYAARWSAGEHSPESAIPQPELLLHRHSNSHDDRPENRRPARPHAKTALQRARRPDQSGNAHRRERHEAAPRLSPGMSAYVLAR